MFSNTTLRSLILAVATSVPSAYLPTFFFLWQCGPTRAMASSFFRFLDHTQRRITLGKAPLDEWAVRRKDLYLTTHNSHNRQTSMPPVGFEPKISAGERSQTYVLDRAATGTGLSSHIVPMYFLSTWGSQSWVPNFTGCVVCNDNPLITQVTII